MVGVWVELWVRLNGTREHKRGGKALYFYDNVVYDVLKRPKLRSLAVHKQFDN